jgi:hypothetical protein
MSNTLIIPGVQVTVVKEVLPQQLAPSGVLGIIGFTEINSGKVVRAASYSRMVEVLGRATTFSLPEARAALDNGVSELVVSPLAATAGSTAIVAFDNGATTPATAFTLAARAPGLWANGLGVTVTLRGTAFDLRLSLPGGGEEVYRNVNVTTTSDRYLVKVLADSAIAKVDLVATATLTMPVNATKTFAGGADASAADYYNALQRLLNEPDVDMVLAAVQDFSSTTTLTTIYSDVIAHCNAMAGDCKGRIGFGQVPPITATSTTTNHVAFASNLVSDRFVLVAPNGVVGAVAGLVGNLSYFQSPTFKALTGLGGVSALTVEDERALLTGGVVPIALERGRGIIILRGITTDGDQINVRRVADRAVRTLKSIGNLFIGLLNTADGRGALKQKLTEAMLQMQKDGAIVPSTDGVDPAFKLDVYSSQADFALGIVRVSMAVRPVRAIDYIYATITVQV